MSSLQDDVREAMRLGISYGKYKAMTRYAKDQEKPPPTKKKKRAPKYTDPQLFSQLFHMWQQGLSDSEIAAAVGLSRSDVQRWRDAFEIPSTHKNPSINTKKYRMEETPYGFYIVENREI